jgi:hypothetical protein
LCEKIYFDLILLQSIDLLVVVHGSPLALSKTRFGSGARAGVVHGVVHRVFWEEGMGKQTSMSKIKSKSRMARPRGLRRIGGLGYDWGACLGGKVGLELGR